MKKQLPEIPKDTFVNGVNINDPDLLDHEIFQLFSDIEVVNAEEVLLVFRDTRTTESGLHLPDGAQQDLPEESIAVYNAAPIVLKQGPRIESTTSFIGSAYLELNEGDRVLVKGMYLASYETAFSRGIYKAALFNMRSIAFVLHRPKIDLNQKALFEAQA